MGKYGTVRPTKKEARYDIHPVWRGIGCFLIILIPFMAYTATIAFHQANARSGWLPVPANLNDYPDMSKLQRAAPQLNVAWNAIERIYYFDLLMFFVFLVLGFGLLSVVYAAMYRVVGPPRYGPYDVPPIKGKRSRR